MLTGILIYVLNIIWSLVEIYLAVCWILMRNAGAHHGYSFWTSKITFLVSKFVARNFLSGSEHSNNLWRFRFDVAGAGACLKRYTDPSFFKAESAFPGIASLEFQREKKPRKVKVLNEQKKAA